MSRKRCKCHPTDAYGGCVECPRCRHWSFDPWADSCERRRCGYEAPIRHTVAETQTTIDWSRL